MPELTFATSEELLAEIARRFPAYILVFRYYPDGGTSGQQLERLTCGVKTQAPSEVLGLLHWAILVLQEQAKVNSRISPGIQPLDGPPR